MASRERLKAKKGSAGKLALPGGGGVSVSEARRVSHERNIAARGSLNDTAPPVDLTKHQSRRIKQSDSIRYRKVTETRLRLFFSFLSFFEMVVVVRGIREASELATRSPKKARIASSETERETE